ncbi:F-box domain-containing protein [Ilyonectria sp. MPI-CAGE-AT-0026]|nr:F-box domain-containing protein [Ilyonectria sp. MPI-CAGE-AT-0026]
MRDYACALCGWFIPHRTDSVSWYNEFRGLCSGPEGIILTGVGLYEDPFEQGEPLVAPIDRDGRWDDSDYNSPPEHQFAAMGEDDQGLGRYGFLFHEACWSLLETFFLPGAVPCERLFDICRSFPLVRYHEGCISWGHDYAGAIQTNDLNIFPWEHNHEELAEFEPHSIFSADPYHGGEVKWLLTSVPKQPPGELPPSSNTTYHQKDCFSSLPIELLSTIAVEMSTCDFLNARLASRSFWPIFDDYHFWASRFKPRSERAWIFERRDDDKRHNWRWIYRQTQTALLSHSLENRKRIWGLAHKLLDIAQLRWTELAGSHPVLSPDQKMTSRASGYLWKDNQDNPCYSLGEGCRILHRQSVPISPTTAHFSIFSVHLGDRVYICGITITSVEGVVINLGYQSENKSSVEISGEITGFVLAIGYRGIQAIQCVIGGNQKTAWLGCPEEVPHTQCLVMSSSITAIEAGFDV